MNFKDGQIISQEDLNFLYESVGWVSYTQDLETLEKAIQQSLAVITAWSEDRLVGLVRAVGDGETILYVQDLLVHPEYQNQQIGTELMSRMLAKYPNVRQKVLMTEEAPDVRYFYEKFEFTSCDQGTAVGFYKEY